ncbi:hypothetical protein KY328_00630 [Candidatus Woesearchaeota archaeon]|nr:hypothetical protein [Candidatus Woesearchaeota archaeon]
MVALIDTLIIAAYAVVLVIIGVVFVKKQKTSEDFFLAHRSLGFFHGMATIFSTIAGGGVIFSLLALSYEFGISIVWYYVAGLAGFIIFTLAVPRIKQIADENSYITLTEVFSHRLSKRCSLVSALITIVIFACFVIVNFVVAGNILNLIFGINLSYAILLFAFIVIAYSFVGGFRAVVWTDIFQMGWIVAAFAVLLVFLFRKAGSLAVLAELPAKYLDPFGMGLPLIIGLFIATIVALFGSQDIFQRVYASKDSRTSKYSLIIAALLLMVIAVLIVIIGMIVRYLFPSIDPASVVAVIGTELLPVGLIGFVLVGFLALANSTADSELLTSASTIIRDFGLFKNTRLKVVWRNRFTLLIIGLVSLVVALFSPSIVDVIIAMYSWFGILGMNVIAALFWRKVKERAVFYSLAVGFGISTVYSIITGDLGTAMLAGLIPGFFILFFGSLLMKR